MPPRPPQRPGHRGWGLSWRAMAGGLGCATLLAWILSVALILAVLVVLVLYLGQHLHV